MPRTVAQPQPTAPRLPTASELATAFEGKLEPRRFSIGYQIGVLAVAGFMILMPLVYAGIIAGTVWLIWLHMTHSAVMFENVRGRAIVLAGVVYIAPIIAGALLVLFLLLPAFWRPSKKGPRPYWVDEREQQLLYAYVNRLCDALHCPRPARIDLLATANASAHVDNGIFGLVRRKLVLTIGLPLASSMTLKELTGVIAHELGHFSQGGFMRLSYIIHGINGWFARLAYSRSGIDEFLDNALAEEPHWTIGLIAGLSKILLWLSRLVLKTLAIISHACCMHLSRQAEFDADYQSGRIVGSDAIGNALQKLPAIDIGNSMAIEMAQQSWARRALPDDLVLYSHFMAKNLPEKAKASLEASLLSADSSWFDTHPPLFKRVAALKKANLKGIMKIDASAKILFKDFDELSKMTTVDLYMSALGNALQPEHIVPTKLPTPKPRPAPQKPATTSQRAPTTPSQIRPG